MLDISLVLERVQYCHVNEWYELIWKHFLYRSVTYVWVFLLSKNRTLSGWAIYFTTRVADHAKSYVQTPIGLFDLEVCLRQVPHLPLQYPFKKAHRSCNWHCSNITHSCYTVRKQSLLLTLRCFHLVFVLCCLRWFDLHAAFHFRNSQFVYLCFAIYRFHSEKQRNDQQHWNKGQKRRTFVENVATFGGSFLVWFHHRS